MSNPLQFLSSVTARAVVPQAATSVTNPTAANNQVTHTSEDNTVAQFQMNQKLVLGGAGQAILPLGTLTVVTKIFIEPYYPDNPPSSQPQPSLLITVDGVSLNQPQEFLYQELPYGLGASQISISNWDNNNPIWVRYLLVGR